MSLDEITVKGIEFWAHHGVLESEALQGQRFILDLTFAIDSSCCMDEVKNTVHYGELAQEAVRFSTTQRFALVESLANELASHLLRAFPLMQSLRLTLHKPQAPIPLHFSDVSICITRAYHTCYLALGSNLGTRERYLDSVCKAIREDPCTKLLAQSSYHETEPYGVLDQPKFLNAALKIRTIYTPMQLLLFCQALEQKAGRVKQRHWGERTLDVDILLYGNDCIETKELQIPHPEMHKRSFVLAPLCELAPELLHPLLQRSMTTLLQALKTGEEGTHEL